MPKKTARPRTPRLSDAEKEFARLIERVERCEQRLSEESPQGPLGLLPDVDVVLRVARSEYESLSGGGTRDCQQVVRNIVRLLAEKVNPDAASLALNVLEDAFAATEDLAVRSGYFVGLGRGMAWMSELESAAIGGAR